jgi:hypothetical protein
MVATPAGATETVIDDSERGAVEDAAAPVVDGSSVADGSASALDDESAAATPGGSGGCDCQSAGDDPAVVASLVTLVAAVTWLAVRTPRGRPE